MKIYTTENPTDRSSPKRVKVGVADYAVAEAGSKLVTSGLGSCVGIALADVDAGVAGLAHAMLPYASADDADQADEDVPEDDRPAGAKYVNTAVPGLLHSMEEAGANRPQIEARLAGGSAMFEFNSADGGVGDRNVAAARKTLETYDIQIVGKDVGGDYGRSLSFEVATGELSVRRAHGETHVI
ncbi:chemotaxis protein CheD [Halobellus sp. Atlit-31R]|nr:chemotaxis protein CheD [Halobellus sp. Atlit-31R]